MIGKMMNVNTRIHDGRVNRAAMLRYYEQSSVGKIEMLIDGHALRVDTLIKKNKLQGKSYQEFLKQLDEEIDRAMEASHNSSSRSLRDLFNNQTAFAVKNLNAGIGEIWKVSQPSRRIAENVLVDKKLYMGGSLSAGWKGIGRSERIRIDTIIRRGLAEGQSEAAIADSVFKGAFGITKNHARSLVVTTTTSVAAQADQQVYLANAKAIQGYQYVAVLDSRTSATCSYLDGKIFPVTDKTHLPPQHFHCRSSTTPIVKSYEDLSKLEGIAQIRKRNLASLSQEQISFYDGQTPLKESYNEWLSRQPDTVVLQHLGDTKRLNLFRSGELKVDQFNNSQGNSVSLQELNQLTGSGFGVAGSTRRFALAKERLDTIKLGAARPDEIYESPDLQKALKEYYELQVGELDGTMSLTNYRGTLLHNKKATKMRVLTTPPNEANLKFNPITGTYNDARMYQPSPATLANSMALVNNSETLLAVDKKFITDFVENLSNSMGVNERAVVAENLRIVIGRFRQNGELWSNMKAVLQGQVKFDVMNVSDYMETQLRKDANLMLRLKNSNYIDPVLGPVQLQDLHDSFIKNIKEKNRWEDVMLYKIAKRLRPIVDVRIPLKIKMRLSDSDLDNFYLKFAKQLSLADSPDRDQVAITLGRSLYNKANYRGTRNDWYKLGVSLLDIADSKGFYKLETFN